MTTLTVPLTVPLHGGGPWADGPPPLLHLLGVPMFLLFLLLAAASMFLVRSRRFGPPPWAAGRQAPEHEAKRVLADRFARGDISSDEFLERASILNWTPGSEAWPTHRGKSKR